MNLTKPIVNGIASKILRLGVLPTLLVILSGFIGWFFKESLTFAKMNDLKCHEERVEKRVDSLEDNCRYRHRILDEKVERVEDRWDKRIERMENRVDTTMTKVESVIDRIYLRDENNN